MPNRQKPQHPGHLDYLRPSYHLLAALNCIIYRLYFIYPYISIFTFFYIYLSISLYKTCTHYHVEKTIPLNNILYFFHLLSGNVPLGESRYKKTLLNIYWEYSVPKWENLYSSNLDCLKEYITHSCSHVCTIFQIGGTNIKKCGSPMDSKGVVQ